MLTYHRTSILDSKTQTVVNTVNTVGVMGKGIAATFKARYPEMFKQYRTLCRGGQFEIGQLWLWKAPNQWVLNFPTKRHWRNPSKLTYLEQGLTKFVAQYEQRSIRDIAFPRLGCGHGGLDWQDVRPLMERYLAPLPIPVYIHDFEKSIGIPEHKLTEVDKSFERSFGTFKQDLRSVIISENGMFETVRNGSSFRVIVDDNLDISIRRANGSEKISDEDLFGLWTSLLRGPVSRDRMSGPARSAAYYLFPILARLPYVRAVELGRPDDTSALAIELFDGSLEAATLSSDPPPG